MVLITQSADHTLSPGDPAPGFDLPATDGSRVSLATFADRELLVLSFTCNHCPYAQGVEQRFIDLAREFMPQGVGFLAISSNDALAYPEDSFENMAERARTKAYPFPYAYDETQSIAKAYGAVCTPHIFVLDRNRTLVYEGRIDDNWKDFAAVTSHDLRDALTAALAGKPVPNPRTNPMGCSIKWKSASRG
ncbi:MAG TPA: thioredoxin family protein [Kiritimatiellia bacterium]|nr:thioredoxin family protein [Kiritimatiellia bacterium]